MKIELRNNGVHLEGYVNVCGRESRTLRDLHGPFIEIIKPGTFAKSLEQRSNVGLMLNHKRNLEPTNLELYEDNIGLRAMIDIDDPEVIELAEHRKLTGFSFGFVAKSDIWDDTQEVRRRTIDGLDLQEVSILSVTPAYIATSIEARDGDTTLHEQRSIEETLEVDDKREKYDVGQLNTYKQHFEFLKGEYKQ
nr:MAG TPA: prohead protease [Caudoviricetes sp.]